MFLSFAYGEKVFSMPAKLKNYFCFSKQREANLALSLDISFCARSICLRKAVLLCSAAYPMLAAV